VVVYYTAAETFAPVGSRGLPCSKPPSDRELMAPPKFANACAGCHLLSFDKRFEGGVPHDRPEVVHAFLMKRFSEYIAAHAGELREVQDPQRNLTGRANGPVNRSVTPVQWVAERVTVAEELLWHKTCVQCHAVTGTNLQDVKIARWDASAKSSAGASASVAGVASGMAEQKYIQPKIAAANMTLLWLPHARFDHDAHRGFSCEGCHPKALSSTESSDVLVPGITTCQTCHAAGTEHAEARCFGCHTYHDWGKRKDVKPTFTMPGLKAENTDEGMMK
jgi:hypothetical protein